MNEDVLSIYHNGQSKYSKTHENNVYTLVSRSQSKIKPREIPSFSGLTSGRFLNDFLFLFQLRESIYQLLFHPAPAPTDCGDSRVQWVSSQTWNQSSNPAPSRDLASSLAFLCLCFLNYKVGVK